MTATSATAPDRIRPRIGQADHEHVADGPDPLDALPEETTPAVAPVVDVARGKATFADLMAKPRRVMTVPITLPGEGDETRTVEMKFRALPGNDYDKLLAEHPPTKKQAADGETFNRDTFAPALLAATAAEPKLSLEEATELWTSEVWAPGELGQLFMAAITVCQAGLNVPFSFAG